MNHTVSDVFYDNHEKGLGTNDTHEVDYQVWTHPTGTQQVGEMGLHGPSMWVNGVGSGGEGT